MTAPKILRTQIKSMACSRFAVSMEYARPGAPVSHAQDAPDWNRERERLKEQMLPFVKEAVKKQMKEEREYYRSRPSLAAKQLETVFGAQGVKKTFVPAVTDQVYEKLERRLRLERIRKGR